MAAPLSSWTLLLEESFVLFLWEGLPLFLFLLLISSPLKDASFKSNSSGYTTLYEKNEKINTVNKIIIFTTDK